jgi:small subunit ribosomal protein S6
LREYEGLLILPADADEALVGTAIDRITKIIEPGGGAVASFDRWGRKRFAYEIGNQNEGYYLVVRFTADPAVQPELERALKLADEVVRHKILAVPKKALATSPAPA